MTREMADKREISAQFRVKRMEMAEFLVEQAEQLQRDSDLANGTTASMENSSNMATITMSTVATTTSTETGVQTVEMEL